MTSSPIRTGAADEWLQSSERSGNGSGRLTQSNQTNLADLLERILDKGVVIAGDISISLVDVELLTIKLRLLIASVDKAREMGINWWENDPFLSTQAAKSDDSTSDRSSRQHGDDELDQRFARLERAVDRLADALGSGREPLGAASREGDG